MNCLENCLNQTGIIWYFIDFLYLDEHARKVLESLLICKANHKAHHEADEEEDVGDHEPGDLHQD